MTDTQDANALAQGFYDQAKPDEPVVRPPDPGTVILDWGLEVDGERMRNAFVRELTGADEEILARLDSRKNNYYVLLTQKIVENATATIGSVDVQENRSVIGDLLIGDVDLLFMQILIATYGDVKEYEGIECPNPTCKALNDFAVDVPGLIQRKRLSTPTPEVDVKLRSGDVLHFHLPRHSDLIYTVTQDDEASETHRNTFMIERCLEAPQISNKREFARRMGSGDRRKVTKALASGPSLDFKEVEVPCPTCNMPIPFVFGWADLLQL